jgi:protein-tyrosine phosphatase
MLDGGRPASTGSVKAMARVGIDLGDHVSRRIDAELADAADLIVTMERAHLAAIASLSPDAARRSFTLRELARLSARVPPSPPGGDLRRWAATVDALRPKAPVLDTPSPDDVADPIGGSRWQYRRTASELAELLAQLTAAWTRT